MTEEVNEIEFVRDQVEVVIFIVQSATSHHTVVVFLLRLGLALPLQPLALVLVLARRRLPAGRRRLLVSIFRLFFFFVLRLPHLLSVGQVVEAFFVRLCNGVRERFFRFYFENDTFWAR